MGRILLNSGGGIHVEDGQIMLLPDGRTTESCACCGPPQPPPPECTRCYQFVEGELEFYAPVKKDFALQVSGILDQQRQYVKAWYEHQIYRPPNSQTGAIGCGCEYLRIDYEYELILNGFAALNGTYYGRDAYSTAAPAGDIISGTASSVDGCNPSGNAFDPDDLTPIAGCTVVDPCDYNCEKRVWIKDVPITGTLVCTRTIYGTCNGIVVSNAANVMSVDLNGYAYIQPTGNLLSYGLPESARINVLGSAQGTAIRPYGTDGDYSVSWFNRVLPNQYTFALPCALTAPTINDISAFGCPGNLNWPMTDFSCHPLWRQTRKALAQTCVLDTITHPASILDVPGCTNEDSYENTGTTVQPGCEPTYNKGYVREEYSAFYRRAEHIWTNA
jgi:hypothetical protein